MSRDRVVNPELLFEWSDVTSQQQDAIFGFTEGLGVVLGTVAVPRSTSDREDSSLVDTTIFGELAVLAGRQKEIEDEWLDRLALMQGRITERIIQDPTRMIPHVTVNRAETEEFAPPLPMRLAESREEPRVGQWFFKKNDEFTEPLSQGSIGDHLGVSRNFVAALFGGRSSVPPNKSPAFSTLFAKWQKVEVARESWYID